MIQSSNVLSKKLSQELERLVKARMRSVALTDFVLEVADTISESLKIDRVSIWRAQNNFESIECVVLLEQAKGILQEPLSLFANEFPNYFKAIQTGKAIIANDARNHFETKEFTDVYLVPNNIYAMIDIPIMLNHQVWGIICCEHFDSIRTWNSNEQLFIEHVANELALHLD